MILRYRGDNDFDIEITPDLVIEFSYRERDDSWQFWNVRFNEDRFGGTQSLGPGDMRDWLSGFRALAMDQGVVPIVTASTRKETL